MVLKHFKFVLQQDTAYEHNSYFLSQAHLHEHIKPSRKENGVSRYKI